MITPAGRVTAVTAVGLIALGVLAGWTAAAVLGVAAATALVGAMAYLWRGDALDVVRTLRPDRVAVGQGALSRLEISSPSGRAVPATVAYDQIDGQLVEIDLPRAAAGTTTAIERTLPTARRGLVPVGPLLVRRSDPFGLAQVDRAFGVPELLWVHPRHHDVPPLPAALLRSLEGPTSDTAPQGTLTFHSLREYVRGDELRHIHWRTSARTGTLMVRKLVDTSLPDVTVLLDQTAAAWTATTFEDGIEVAASVLCASARARFPTRLVLSTGEVVQPTEGSVAQRFLDHLTPIELVSADGLPVAIERLANEGRGTAVVVITGSGDRLRLARLSGLRRRFTQVVAVVVRPAGRAPVGVQGIEVVDVPSAAAFVTAWRGTGVEVAG